MTPRCPQCENSGSVMTAARAETQGLILEDFGDLVAQDLWFCALCQTEFSGDARQRELTFA